MKTKKRKQVPLRMVGITPLIVHRFDEKAITKMFTGRRTPQDAQKDLEACKYFNVNDEECVPSIMFKKAAVEASTFGDGLSRKQAREAFFVIGEYLPLGATKAPFCRARVCRAGHYFFRARPEYHNWYVDLVVDYDADMIALDKLIYTFREAGRSIGIGEWRVEKDGQFGWFEVEKLPNSKIEEIIKRCQVAPRPLVLPEWVMRAVGDLS